MRILLSVIVVILFFGWLCPSASMGADRVKIGLAAPLSGSSKVLGLSIKAAVEFAINDINEKGGVLGRDFELVVADDLCFPEPAIVAAENLAYEEKVKFVVGHVCSAASIEASKVYKENNIIQITPASTAPELTERDFENVYRLSIRSDRMGEFIGSYLGILNIEKYKIGLVFENSGYVRDLVNFIEEAANKESKKIILSEYYNPSQSDFGSIIAKLKYRQINVACIISRSATDQLKILHTMRANGHDALAVVNGAPGSSIFEVDYGRSEKIGAVLLSGFPDYTNLDSANSLTEKLRKEGFKPDQYSLYAYAAVEIYAEAASRAKNFNYKNIIKELKPEKNFETIIGHLSFDSKGDAIDITPIFYKLEKGEVVAMNTRPPPPPPPPY